MMIKGNELKELVSANMEFHNYLIEGLDCILSEGWDDQLVNDWNDFRQLLSFKKNIDIDSYEAFINLLTEIKEVNLPYFVNEAAVYIKFFDLVIGRLALYKNCLVSGMSLELGQILQDVFEVVEMKAVGGAE